MELQFRQPAKRIALLCAELARETAQSVPPGVTREPVNQYLASKLPTKPSVSSTASCSSLPRGPSFKKQRCQDGDDRHVVGGGAVRAPSLSISEDEEGGNTRNGQGDEGQQKTGTSARLLRRRRSLKYAMRERAEAQPPARSLPAGPPSSHSRYPLNSRRLTAWHLHTLAKALGLPTSGSPDKLRQCVEGIVQRDRDHHNVIVVVHELLKTEQRSL